MDASLDDDDNDYVEKDDILSAMEDRDGVASQLEDLPDDMLLDDMDGEDDLEDLDEDLSFIDDEEEEAEAEDSNIITMDDF